MVTVHDLTRPPQQAYADREGGWGLALVNARSADSAQPFGSTSGILSGQAIHLTEPPARR